MVREEDQQPLGKRERKAQLLAQNESNFIKKDSQGLLVIDTGSGLPTVTEEQVVSKAYRVVGSFYNMVAQIAPHITPGVVVMAAIAGVCWNNNVSYTNIIILNNHHLNTKYNYY